MFGNWQIWVFALGMGTLAFLQLIILNQGERFGLAWCGVPYVPRACIAS